MVKTASSFGGQGDAGERGRPIREVPRSGVPTRWVHPEWEASFPWLAQGTTGRGEHGRRDDFAVFRGGGERRPLAAWLQLARVEGFGVVVHARQLHGRRVLVHGSLGQPESTPSGGLITQGADGPASDTPQVLPVPDAGAGASGAARFLIAPDADGHASGTADILMGITVADCVPVFLVDPERRAAALLHAGWRGIAAGILEEGLRALRTRFGSRSRDLHVHLGPAICGGCYEVGREVHRALGLDAPPGPQPVDLRATLADRARRGGVRGERMTVSSFCTQCGDPPFFSHRGGDSARQVAFLGLRGGGVDASD